MFEFTNFKNYIDVVIIIFGSLFSLTTLGQNLVVNGDFETQDLTGWIGFNNQNLNDVISNSRVGNVNNGEGSLRQDIAVISGTSYVLNFDYRWVSGTGNYNMNVVVRRDSNNAIIESFTVSTTPDQWFKGSISFIVPTGETAIQIVFYKTVGNRPFRLDKVILNEFQGNLIENSRFTLDNTTPSFSAWEGFNQDSRIDNLTGEFVGFIDNDGTLRQDFPVVPGVEYLISFNYRWVDVGRPSGNAITPQLRNPSLGGAPGVIEFLSLADNASDTWYTAYFTYVHPNNSTLNEIRLQFFKGMGFNQLHINHVTVIQKQDLGAKADYYFENGTWFPSNPIGISTLTDDVVIYNGKLTIDGDLAANNLIVSGWADVDLENVLDVNNQLVIEDGGVLTFKSGLTQTAQLKRGTVIGNARVERYIPAATNNRRAFRFVSSAVNSTLPIYNNWQMNGSLAPDQFGTHITGSADGLNGFDETTTGNASMFTFDTSWDAIPNTDNTNLEVGQGYRLMVRGDRKYDLTSNPAVAPNSDVILRASGTLLSGTITTGNQIPALSTVSNGFSLVGNPYQAVVDISQVEKTNLLDYIYVWDATIAGLNGRGAFVVVEISSNSIALAPPASSSNASVLVAPGQSFFVRNTTGAEPIASSLTFEEADKVTTTPDVQIFSEGNPFYINSRLYKTSDLQSGNTEMDAIGLRFNEAFTLAGSDEDAPKIANTNENFAIVNNGLRAIDKQPIPIHEHNISLFVNGYTETDYSLSFAMGNKPDNVQVYLVDNYLGTQTLLTEEMVYDFSVDASITESIAQERFSLFFEVETLSDENFTFNNELQLYPNPSDKGEFTIQTKALIEEEANLEIYNMLGQKVWNEKVSVQNHRISVSASSLIAGMYVVQLKQANQVFSSKLLIQ